MRSILCLAVILGGTQVNVFEARGFVERGCYQHAAVRRCVKDAKTGALKCQLKVFSGRVGSLTFPLDPVRDALLAHEASTDYGIMTFRIDSYTDKGVPQIRIGKVERVPLRKWESVQEDEPVANAVNCSAK